MVPNLFKSILPLTVFAAVLNFATPQAEARRTELYVTSLGSDQVLRYDADTGNFLGAFISSGGELDAPDGFVFGPDGNAYVSGFYSDNILKYDGRTGQFLNIFASNVDGAAQIVFDRHGNLLVNSYGDEQTACQAFNSCSILRFDKRTGDFLDVFASRSSGYELDGPDGLLIGPDGYLYVSSFLTDEIVRYDLDTGEFLGVFASGGGLDRPSGFNFGPDGDLYVTSWGTGEVLRYDGNTGNFLDVFASGAGVPTRLAFGPDNNLYVSSIFSNEVLKYNGESGAFLGTFISGVSLPTDLVFVTEPEPVPEPSSVLGTALAALGAVTWRKRKQRTKNSV